MVDIFGTVSSTLSLHLPSVRRNILHKSTFPGNSVASIHRCHSFRGESDIQDSYESALITGVSFFQLYSVYAVLSGVVSVNDCPEASKELTEEIAEARKDLISRGFKFRD